VIRRALWLNGTVGAGKTTVGNRDHPGDTALAVVAPAGWGLTSSVDSSPG
jgi:hypothetical protein